MFVARVKSKGKAGKIYESILLRESVREGSRVNSRTLAILTKMPKWLIDTIEAAVKRHAAGDEPVVFEHDEPSPTEAITSINQSAESPVTIEQCESFAAFWLVKCVADKIGISHALRPANCPKNLRQPLDKDYSQIAVLRVCARLLNPGISLLGITRFVNMSCARRLFSWQHSWTEDDLYEHHGTWLSNRQPDIEKSLWKKNHTDSARDSDEDLFLYDVTSSYFEGTENELSAFGYNRDGKKGKKQVVIGLLTDRQGDPCSIKVYTGETRDFNTFGDALDLAKNLFQADNIVMVGDRGMIKSDQIQAVTEAGGFYISSLTKPQINKLLRRGVFQLELFDEDVAEVIDKDGTGERYILRRNPVRAEEMKTSRRGKQAALEAALTKSNNYLKDHPGADVKVQIKHLSAKLTKLRLKRWISIEQVSDLRELKTVIDEEALQEEEKLDGCYVVRSNLPAGSYQAEAIHDRV